MYLHKVEEQPGTYLNHKSLMTELTVADPISTPLRVQIPQHVLQTMSQTFTIRTLRDLKQVLDSLKDSELDTEIFYSESLHSSQRKLLTGEPIKVYELQYGKDSATFL